MKIVFFRYKSICEPDYIEAFSKLEIEVVEDLIFGENGEVTVTDKMKHAAEVILREKPLFVFSINFFPALSSVCEKLGMIYVALSVDCPVLELFSTEIRNRCNRVFLFDYSQYLSIHDENPTGIFYMALGSNVERFNRTLTGALEFDYDVSFVGSLYSEKAPLESAVLPERVKGYCDGLIMSQLQVPGMDILEGGITKEIVEAFAESGQEHMNLTGVVKDMNRYVIANEYLAPSLAVRERHHLLNNIGNALSACEGEDGPLRLHLFTGSDTGNLQNVLCHGTVESLSEMPVVFRKSRINLNLNLRSISMGLPQRIWDVLGCGGFLLTNYVAELPEYFEIGKHVEAFESTDEAVQKTIYYLEHEEERAQIARNGYELVSEKHTVLQRVIYMINTICG